MALIRINRNPPRRQLALFGALWLIFFAIVGWIVWDKTQSRPASLSIWTLAVVIPVIGWIWPAWMRIVYVGAAYAAFPIGLVISHVVLALVYYAVLTPTGLLVRLFLFDPMRRRFEPEAKTYWVRRREQQDVKRYFRQF
jgi:hypothetical protein